MALINGRQKPMDRPIYYDIETYIDKPTAEKILAKKKFSAPSNWKDPDKIAQNVAEQAENWLSRCALHWTTAKVVCICAIDGDDVFKIASDNERSLLEDFSLWSSKPGSTLVGKSNHIFDDGFLIGRYMVNHLLIPRPLTARTFDVNQVFGYGRNHPQQSSLNSYAIAFGLDEKLASGDQVHEMVNEGRYDDIADYCLQDVLLVKQITERYLRLGGSIAKF
jgi:hypothetical protein